MGIAALIIGALLIGFVLGVVAWSIARSAGHIESIASSWSEPTWKVDMANPNAPHGEQPSVTVTSKESGK